MSFNLFEALSKPKTIVGGRASATTERKIEPIGVVEPARQGGRDYAKNFVNEEKRKYFEEVERSNKPHDDEDSRPEAMSEVDTMTNRVSEITTDDRQKRLSVYSDFDFDTRTTNVSLPILDKKTEILKMVSSYRFVIIKGATGCGKTTQVPQFILDRCKSEQKDCNIVVTQPRRIAAVSVAKRVCKERNWKLGSVVGYQIGQHKEVSDNTMITFCTTGVLLQKIVKKKNIQDYTHIILDEVHERDAEMDFLLILVRKYANTNSIGTKVVLMSATINADVFSEYCFIPYATTEEQAPVIAASTKNPYPVKIFYLDDLHEIPEHSNMIPENESPDITKKGYVLAAKIVKAIDQLERETAEKKKINEGPGSVLVFLPGLFEIEEMEKVLLEYSSDIYKWWIVPLHSSITTDEQDKVFQNPPDNHRKIVLSTNIAESSITVPDIRYVIDFGLTKFVVTDQETNLGSLQLNWASKNSMTQRAGRAGRVKEGRVYRLVERRYYDSLEEESTPEMLRCPLNQLVLKTKLLDCGPPQAIFALAMSQPDLRNIEQTVLSLKEIGALTVAVVKEPQNQKSRVGDLDKDIAVKEPQNQKSQVDDLDGDLTELGSYIAKLPMDVRLGKLIFFGDLFNVLDECIIMACAMSVKNMFMSPFREYLKAYNSKLAWANSSCSDCIAYLQAFTVWRKKKVENAFRGRNSEEEWCRVRFIQLKILKEIAHLVEDVKKRLNIDLARGISQENSKRSKLSFHEKNLFIKLSLAAAFYPNYFLRGTHSGKVDEQQAVATLSGHDPFSSVYLQGMPTNQYGILYKKTIEKHFEDVSSRVNINFDHGSKVLINFGHYAKENAPGSDQRSMLIPGKIDLAVYRAVKLRQLKPEIRIPVFNAAEAEKRVHHYLQRYEQIRRAPSYLAKLLEWPWDKTLDTRTLPLVGLRITYIDSPARFWARSSSRLITEQYHEISEFLNRPGNVVPIPEDEDIKIGNIYAYSTAAEVYGKSAKTEYVRCRIESHKYFNNSYSISFIDIGDGKTGVRRDDIRAISDSHQNHYDEIPDLATEFSLVKVQPLSRYGSKWSDKSINFLKKFQKYNDHRKMLIGQIYSMVNNVARVTLYYRWSDQNDKLNFAQSINQQLITDGIAEKTDEPFLSKQDHEERKRLSQSFEQGEGSLISVKNQTERDKINETLSALDLDEPTRSECRHEVVLKGPFSPLEMRVFSATRCSMPKLAIIERNSVNSVLLDTNPSDEHERMVVAAFVGISASRDKLSLRDTTVMPSLPGLPALICLLFSPMVEMRCDPDFTRFTGALCGLGYEKDTGRALNGDRDIEITFDVEITLDMLVVINRVRFWLSRFLAPEKHQPLMTSQEKESGYNNLHNYVNELVWHKWGSEEMFYTTEAHKWGKIPPNKLLSPCSESPIEHPAEDVISVYRLIWGIDMDGDQNVRLEMIKKNLETLKKFSSGTLYVKEVECKLCQVVLSNRMNARLHLKSSLHKARAMKYKVEPANSTSYCDSRSEVTTDGYDYY